MDFAFHAKSSTLDADGCISTDWLPQCKYGRSLFGAEIPAGHAQPETNDSAPAPSRQPPTRRTVARKEADDIGNRFAI